MSKARPSIDERLTFDTTSETTPAIDAEKGHGNGHATATAMPWCGHATASPRPSHAMAWPWPGPMKKGNV